jgi:MFS family permease
MPQWVIFLALAIAAWFLVSVVGGLLLGRLLSFIGRRRPHAGRRIV